MARRTISGILLAVAAALCIFGGVIPVGAAIWVLSTFALAEFYAHMRIRPFFKGIGYFWNAVLIILALLYAGGMKGVSHTLLWIPFVSLFFFHLFGHIIGHSGKLEESLQYQTGIVFAGFLWISQTLAVALLIRAILHGAWWLFLGVGATASCDIGAFGIGKLLGRHKFVPALSPGKTIEGVIGGAALCLMATLFLGAWAHLEVKNRVQLGLILALAAISGDLLESGWKRKVGVKDSGTIMVGHGGVLDRIDSHLLALPALYAFLYWSGSAK